MHPVVQRIVKSLASIKLAVIIILGLAAVSAVGTIYEANYDAEYAMKLVYESYWMMGFVTLLAICLIAVMVDRWPWQRKHTGFILAHIGILILILGQWMTGKYGVDGSMIFRFGESSKAILLQQKEFSVHVSKGEGDMTSLFKMDAEFLKNPPSEKNPIVVKMDEQNSIKVTDYMHYASRTERVVTSNVGGDGPAVRFLLQNSRVSSSKWLHTDTLRRTVSEDLGPARVVLTQETVAPTARNEIWLRVHDKDKTKLEYSIFYAKDPKKITKGLISAGDKIPTGWMDLEFQVVQYYPNAKKEVDFERKEKPSGTTTSAVKIDYDGTGRWIGLNEIYKFFTNNYVYFIIYGNKRLTLDTALTLKDFQIGRYQGTMRAASYQSLVAVGDQGEVLISMNNPLKFKGFTFYQASFQEDERGQPTASVLSVNYDPGRWLKYLGSLLICLGAAILFWFKRAKIFKGA